MGIFLTRVPRALTDDGVSPKEDVLLHGCHNERASGRLVFKCTPLHNTRVHGIRRRSSSDSSRPMASRLESSGQRSRPANAKNWMFEVKGPRIEVLITHPDQVRANLDLPSWPTMVFLQSGRSVYTLQPAVRRSWRIRQKAPVDAPSSATGTKPRLSACGCSDCDD